MGARRHEAVSAVVAAVSVLAAVVFVALPQPASAGAPHGGAHDAPAAPSSAACASVTGAARRAECTASLLPAHYPMMAMGRPALGGGRASPAAAHRTPVGDLVGPTGPAQDVFTLVAATGTQQVDGVTRPALTFNGTTPGPTLTVTQGDLVEVRLVNTDIAAGVTIHWHGVDVPGGEDGVAGVTQDAVLPGHAFVYRFVVPDAGTYWYHSHQDSVREVGLGLLGALVVQPSAGAGTGSPTAVDVVALLHTYGTTSTINGRPGLSPVDVPVGTPARVRVINGGNGPELVTASAPFRVVAIDGTDIPGGDALADTYVDVPAGGRVDILVDVGAEGVRVGSLFGPALALGPPPLGAAPPLAARTRFDPLAYGSPGAGARARDAFGPADRAFTYRVGTRSGYLKGRSGHWFTIDGRLIPRVPMFVVHTGDIVRWHVVNRTPVPHPMHLHGHHALVVSRDGAPTTGAPWWVDSLEVDPGEAYDLLMVADNPGVWMFHCHNLPHARAGLMTHLMYDTVADPYQIGRVRPGLVNEPE
jgi:FtsP/CotA-like multicopper oxidase with cupredoxin domain